MIEPYRLVYYNRQLLVASDYFDKIDYNYFLSTSPTMNLIKNYCPSNKTYDG